MASYGPPALVAGFHALPRFGHTNNASSAGAFTATSPYTWGVAVNGGIVAGVGLLACAALALSYCTVCCAGKCRRRTPLSAGA